MDSKKRKKLEAKGWVFGDAADFLDLSPEEARLIDLKLALRASIKEERLKQDITQEELAKAMGSSQSRIAKMERGDPAVSVDFLLRALMALGMSNKQISKIIA
ncbi:transcriptional regulator [bacterium CG_4_9_14_3_um_filter_65_15]|nr:MAG: transcriptional regulator [bacterium CG_4_9_14_3_um_filter_65_15]